MSNSTDDNDAFNEIMQDFSLDNPQLSDAIEREEKRKEQFERGIIDQKDYDLLVCLPHRDEITDAHAWSVKTVFSKEDTITLLESILYTLKNQ